jgi:hypothetical protein
VRPGGTEVALSPGDRNKEKTPVRRKNEIRRVEADVVDLAVLLYDEMAKQELESDPRVESRGWMPGEDEPRVEQNASWQD